MGNKLNRVIKTLIDLDEFNPIISIHDQGAGGLANVVKEIDQELLDQWLYDYKVGPLQELMRKGYRTSQQQLKKT